MNTKYILIDDSRGAYVKSINTASFRVLDVQTCETRADAQDFDTLAEAEECAKWLVKIGYDVRVEAVE